MKICVARKIGRDSMLIFSPLIKDCLSYIMFDFKENDNTLTMSNFRFSTKMAPKMKFLDLSNAYFMNNRVKSWSFSISFIP